MTACRLHTATGRCSLRPKQNQGYRCTSADCPTLSLVRPLSFGRRLHQLRRNYMASVASFEAFKLTQQIQPDVSELKRSTRPISLSWPDEPQFRRLFLALPHSRRMGALQRLHATQTQVTTSTSRTRHCARLTFRSSSREASARSSCTPLSKGQYREIGLTTALVDPGTRTSLLL